MGELQKNACHCDNGNLTQEEEGHQRNRNDNFSDTGSLYESASVLEQPRHTKPMVAAVSTSPITESRTATNNPSAGVSTSCFGARTSLNCNNSTFIENSVESAPNQPVSLNSVPLALNSEDLNLIIFQNRIQRATFPNSLLYLRIQWRVQLIRKWLLQL